MNFKSQEIKRITIKSPSIPLFPPGRWPGGPLAKGRQGGIFKALKYYHYSNIKKGEAIEFEVSGWRKDN